LIEPSPASEELLLKTHTSEYLQRLKRRWDYRGARLTVGGCADAALRILEGAFRNVLCFGVAAGHHAERDSGWGGTYASVCGGIRAVLEEKYGHDIRIAILDTDSHHGNGTRDVTLGHRNILHVCFCSTDRILDEGTKICIDSGYNTTDKAYLAKVETHFLQRIEQFQPEIVIHLLGHDTARGDYGSRGLSREFFLELVELVKKGTKKVCKGRYLINTHGGANLSICEYIHPRIIRILAS
jgi:acetoin utilization deacetylase AcuC-like enzyme